MINLFQIGESLTIHQEKLKNNNTTELITKLSDIVDHVASSVKSLIDKELDNFQFTIMDGVASTNRGMEREENAMSRQLDDYKAKANAKKVDISACLGDDVKNLEKELSIHSHIMFRCADDLVNITRRSGLETYTKVRAQFPYKILEFIRNILV